jgi:hypothetical protein
MCGADHSGTAGLANLDPRPAHQTPHTSTSLNGYLVVRPHDGRYTLATARQFKGRLQAMVGQRWGQLGGSSQEVQSGVCETQWWDTVGGGMLGYILHATSRWLVV